MKVGAGAVAEKNSFGSATLATVEHSTRIFSNDKGAYQASTKTSSYLGHEVPYPAGTAPVGVLAVGHVNEVHLVVLTPHDMGHGTSQSGTRLHRVQSSHT